jgi:hypothetical protein
VLPQPKLHRTGQESLIQLRRTILLAPNGHAVAPAARIRIATAMTALASRTANVLAAVRQRWAVISVIATPATPTVTVVLARITTTHRAVVMTVQASPIAAVGAAGTIQNAPHPVTVMTVPASPTVNAADAALLILAPPAMTAIVRASLTVNAADAALQRHVIPAMRVIAPENRTAVAVGAALGTNTSLARVIVARRPRNPTAAAVVAARIMRAHQIRRKFAVALAATARARHHTTILTAMEAATIQIKSVSNADAL